MAGMLPGVEAARRRRFHHSNHNYGSEISAPISSTRRSSFCLYAVSSYEFHSKPSMRNPVCNQQQQQQQQGLFDDESRLCAAAREAKKRLDERLQSQRRSQIKRVESSSRATLTNHQSPSSRSRSSLSGCPDYMPKSKKSNWLKLINWKTFEQDECAVCLEQLTRARAGQGGDNLMRLPCGHRFHTKCLMPWLQANINAHCPCCRMEINLV